MRCKLAPGVPGCLPGDRPVGARDGRDGLAGPSDDGGLEELPEFCANRRCNSTTRASSRSIRCACSSITRAWAATNASNSSRDGSTPDTRRSSTPDSRSHARHARIDQLRPECLLWLGVAMTMLT